MLIESVAIIVVIGMLILLIARAGRRDTAAAVLPLLIVPGAYLLSLPASHLTRGLFPRALSITFITVTGLMAACLLFGMLCGNFSTRRTRRAYLLMCGGFSAILAVVLVLNTVPPL